MIFNYCDEDERLGNKLIDIMEAAVIEAVATELDIERAALADMPIELSITIVGPDDIREINREYRGIDSVTDVLSFPQYADADEIKEALEDCGDCGMLLGDVVICYDRAMEQAEEYGTGRDRELVYLTVHSIFHLLGYDHMEEDERTLMRNREESVMSAIGLSR